MTKLEADNAKPLQATDSTAGSALALQIEQAAMHDVTFKAGAGGSYQIVTTGTNPHLFTAPFPAGSDLKRYPVLTFDYFCAGGTDHMQVFAIPPCRENRSVKSKGLANSEGWSAYSLDLSQLLAKVKEPITSLRLDFGSIPGRTIQLKNLRMRAPSSQELRLAAGKEGRIKADQQLESSLRAYLAHEFSSKIDKIEVNPEQIVMHGIVGHNEVSVVLGEAPIWTTITTENRYVSLIPIHLNPDRSFSICIPRHPGTGAQMRDRLLSRWCILSADAGHRLLSHERYADQVTPAHNLPHPVIRNKKGIGGFGGHGPESDLEDLGVSTVTVNVVLNSLLFTRPGAGRTPFVSGGKTWYSNDEAISQLDHNLVIAARHNLVVSAILLIGQPGSAPEGDFSRLIAYPDADPSGIFVMPDVAHAQGVAAYAAVLDLLASRYSSSDLSHGRIHHWILHNEVNAGWVWTNAGEKSALVYMDLYQRSMRMAHLISRQYNGWSKAFISLEHHWTMRPAHIYAGRELLEDLAAFSKAEGDFDWGIAFHPYPQNLFDPMVWKDQEAQYRFDTPKITFKNLEVLDAFVKLPAMRYLGKTIRPVHLTEQGLNSKDYSEVALANQAAGMAYAWNKIKRLSTIESFDYHNWIDNRGEGGLRIGLRRFPDDANLPMGKKPIWYIYQAAGTPSEQQVFAGSLKRIGLQDWSQIMHAGQL